MAKRIGFVDYRLENFHANVYLKAFRNELKDRGFTVAGCWATDDENGRAWAAKNDVPYFGTPQELDANVDAYMILAPSNPETHLELAEKVFPFRKITYVDKTFAPDLATAKKIFKLADKHKVPMQTTSALRYTNVQKAAEALPGGRAALKHMTAWGNGGSFNEYAIHPVEMVVSCMGPAAESLMRRGEGDSSQLLINFSEGRTATINVYANTETPFAATLTDARNTKWVEVDLSTLFIDMARGIADFFDRGTPTIDRQESLTVRKILDAAGKPAALKRFVNL